MSSFSKDSFSKGDYVVSTWGLEKRVFQIELKPKLKSGIMYITLLIDGVRRECLAQWWRHAEDFEVASGSRG